MRAVESSRTIASSFWLSTERCELRTRSSFESFSSDDPRSTTENGFVQVFQSERDSQQKSKRTLCLAVSSSGSILVRLRNVDGEVMAFGVIVSICEVFVTTMKND